MEDLKLVHGLIMFSMFLIGASCCLAICCFLYQDIKRELKQRRDNVLLSKSFNDLKKK